MGVEFDIDTFLLGLERESSFFRPFRVPAFARPLASVRSHNIVETSCFILSRLVYRPRLPKAWMTAEINTYGCMLQLSIIPLITNRFSHGLILDYCGKRSCGLRHFHHQFNDRDEGPIPALKRRISKRKQRRLSLTRLLLVSNR